MQDKEVKKYCDEVAEKFTEEYNEKIEENINKMLKEFGFEGNKEGSVDFLNKNGYQLLLDSEKNEKYSIKIIYLAKKDKVMACFMVKMLYNENLTYEISDILINREDD